MSWADCLPRLAMSRRRELGRQWLSLIAAWTLDAAPEAHAELLAGRAGDLPVAGGHWHAPRT